MAKRRNFTDRFQAKVIREKGALFILAHNYTDPPMIRQARELVARGALGAIRVVQVDTTQDWLADDTGGAGSYRCLCRPAQIPRARTRRVPPAGS